MKKVVSCFLALIVICCSVLFLSVSVSASGYNPSAAVDYASQYWNNYNPAYRNYNSVGGDCANFVSQCLYAGGLQQDDVWYNGSGAWINCSSQIAHFRSLGYTVIDYAQASDIQIGNPVYYYNGNSMAHTAICVGFSNDGTPLVAAHNKNHWAYEWTLGGPNYWGGSSRRVTILMNRGSDPTGVLDSVTGGVGKIHLSGWAFDKDDLGAKLNIHVYIGGPSGDSNAEGHNQTWANTGREDVNNSYGCGSNHGFDDVIYTGKSGTQQVYVYAINVEGGSNVLIGSGTVNISADTEKPVVERAYFDSIKSDGFWPCFTVKDNVAIKVVRVATWTRGDQSDLIWHDAVNNGYGTYFVDVKRADYSPTQNSIYYNHAYIYDYAGNCTFAAIDMVYRISSDTGKNVPEGKYRIVTAVNESRALDVYAASLDNGANIQIYSNLNDKNQRFDLQYTGNGFYQIINSYTKKAIDVQGDTYLNNTNVIQGTPYEGPNQKWMLKPSGDGYYYIIAHSNGLALDVTNALDQDFANVAVHTQNQSTAQKWKLRRVLDDNMVMVGNVRLHNSTDEIKPEIAVIADSDPLIEGKDYTVSIKGDAATGKGVATITGINDYCDDVILEFSITVEPTIPTSPSTETPTQPPTNAPTQPPTDAPTQQQTNAPTQPPTNVPTQPATEIPTQSVTEILLKVILGDTDDDGEVTIFDATTIQRHLADLPTKSFVEAAADADEDGEVTIFDATAIQRHLADLPANKNIGKPMC